MIFLIFSGPKCLHYADSIQVSPLYQVPGVRIRGRIKKDSKIVGSISETFKRIIFECLRKAEDILQ